MSKLTWDLSGDRKYSTGVDRGALYPRSGSRYLKGEAWNGLISVSENPSGGEATALYADNTKYLNLMSVEELGLGIEAYDYPEGFSACLGMTPLDDGIYICQQERKHFGFVYRTLEGNDTEGTKYGYDLHVIFDCVASPSEESNSTVNDSPEANTNSWDVNTVPINIDEERKSASMTLGLRAFSDIGLYNVFKSIENILYGTEETEPSMLKPANVLELIETEKYLMDSSGNPILDDTGNKMLTTSYWNR